MTKIGLTLLLLLLAIYSAQTTTQYFALNSTLAHESFSEIAQGHMGLKFHMVDATVLLANITVMSEVYLLYYYARSAQMCVSSASMGTVLLNIDYGISYDIAITHNKFVIQSFEVMFANTNPGCPRSQNLTDTYFGYEVAELQMETGLATSFASGLSTYRELSNQSCEFSTSGICTACIDGYTLDAGACILLPYGCLHADGTGCLVCRDGFQYDGANNKCYDGTKALASSQQYFSDGDFLGILGIEDWAVQFYFLALPQDPLEVSQIFYIVKVTELTEYIGIRAEYNYQFTTGSINEFKLSLKGLIGTTIVQSNSIEVPLGQWLALGVYYTPPDTYTLSVQKYGMVSVTGGHFIPAYTRLSLQNMPLLLYYKELLLWKNQILTVNNSTTHNCRFNHPIDFTPYIQFNLDVNSNTANTSLSDSQSNTLDVSPLIVSSTLSDIIEEVQPIARLDSNYFQSTVPNTELCLPCAPNCGTCSGFFECQVCDAGQLINGLCIEQFVFPSSGEANVTLFSFDWWDFNDINEHAIMQLVYDQGTQLLHYNALMLQYPNATQIEIPDESSFIVPRFHQAGVSEFNATLYLNYTLYGVQHSSLFTTLTLIQDEYSEAEDLTNQMNQAKVSLSDDNPCECSEFGTCTLQELECECQAGYAGTHCQFLASDLNSFQVQVQDAVMNISQHINQKTDQAVLSQLSLISAEQDTLTTLSQSLIIDLTKQVITLNTTDSLKQLAFDVLSNVSELTESSQNIDLTKRISSVVDVMVFQSIVNDTPLNITSSKITAQIHTLSSSSDSSIQPNIASNTSFTLPTSLLPDASSTDSTKLVTVLYNEAIYKSLPSFEESSSSEVLTLQFY